MTRWLLLTVTVLSLVAGCSQTSSTADSTKPAEKPVIKTEPGKGQPTTSNNELQLNPNRGDANQAGTAMKGGK